MFEINIASDFSTTPGGRYKSLGNNSGELFYENYLLPKYNEAIANNKYLIVNLDGTTGYTSSFLDESFGRLYREKGFIVKSTIKFNSRFFEWIIDYIKDYIWK